MEWNTGNFEYNSRGGEASAGKSNVFQKQKSYAKTLWTQAGLVLEEGHSDPGHAQLRNDLAVSLSSMADAGDSFR